MGSGRKGSGKIWENEILFRPRGRGVGGGKLLFRGGVQILHVKIRKGPQPVMFSDWSLKVEFFIWHLSVCSFWLKNEILFGLWREGGGSVLLFRP